MDCLIQSPHVPAALEFISKIICKNILEGVFICPKNTRNIE